LEYREEGIIELSIEEEARQLESRTCQLPSIMPVYQSSSEKDFVLKKEPAEMDPVAGLAAIV
jgi:hypothetical protein